MKGRIYHDCVNDILLLVLKWTSKKVILEGSNKAFEVSPVVFNSVIKHGFVTYIGDL